MPADVGPAQVVGDDEDDVGSPGVGLHFRGGRPGSAHDGCPHDRKLSYDRSVDRSHENLLGCLRVLDEKNLTVSDRTSRKVDSQIAYLLDAPFAEQGIGVSRHRAAGPHALSGISIVPDSAGPSSKGARPFRCRRDPSIGPFDILDVPQVGWDPLDVGLAHLRKDLLQFPQAGRLGRRDRTGPIGPSEHRTGAGSHRPGAETGPDGLGPAHLPRQVRRPAQSSGSGLPGSMPGIRPEKSAAKRELVRWRLHALLADLTDELAHYEAAVAAFPDLPSGHAELGCALCRAGRLADALPHLRGPWPISRSMFPRLGPCFSSCVTSGWRMSRRPLSASGGSWPAPRRGCPAGAVVRAVGEWHATACHRHLLGNGRRRPVHGARRVRRSLRLSGRLPRLCGYTRAADTHAVLTLLAHAQPRRVLEVGTALGHMTANLTEWTPDDAHVFSLGIVRGMVARGAAEQDNEAPSRAELGRLADHFGKAHKAYFIIADSMTYDFGRLAPLDFVFIDGGHDLEHALNDTRRAYEAIKPGGWLVWHDFNSPVAWVKVREAIERLGLPDPVIHVGGTEVAFLRKQAPLPAPRAQRPPRSGPVRVVWEGDQQGLHSLALVNRGALPGVAESWARPGTARGDRRKPRADAGSAPRRPATVGPVRTRTGGRAGPGPRAASLAAEARPARARTLGVDAALGVRQPAQSWLPRSARGRSLGVQSIGSRLLPRSGRAPPIAST